MSPDLRISIFLWVGAIAGVALFWAALKLEFLSGVPDSWVWPVVGALAVIDGTRLLFGLWQRRASNPNNPNHL